MKRFITAIAIMAITASSAIAGGQDRYEPPKTTTPTSTTNVNVANTNKNTNLNANVNRNQNTNRNTNVNANRNTNTNVNANRNQNVNKVITGGNTQNVNIRNERSAPAFAITNGASQVGQFSLTGAVSTPAGGGGGGIVFTEKWKKNIEYTKELHAMFGKKTAGCYLAEKDAQFRKVYGRCK